MELILTLAIFSGQIIKLPLTQNSGITILDTVVFLLSLWGLFEIKGKFKKPPLPLLFFILFSLFGVVSLFISPLSLSLQERFISLTYSFRFLLYLFFGWILYSGGLTTIRSNFFSILKNSGFLLALAGLFQLIFIPNLQFLSSQGWDPHYFRTVSTFLDPNFLGGFLSLVLILILSKFEDIKKDRKSRMIFIVCFIALVTTFSRSATLFFLSSTLLLSGLKKSSKLFFLLIIFSGIFGVAFLGYHQFISEPRNIDRGQSASFRLSAYDEGIQIFQHSPIFGVGFNSYRYALKEYNLASDSVINSHGGSTNDSSFLYILATTGILGFSLYFGGILFLIVYCFLPKHHSNESIYFISAFVGLIIQSFFVNTLFYPWMLLWIFISFIKASDNSV